MTTKPKKAPHSDLAIPPGELLEEELRAAGMTPQQLAIGIGISEPATDAIIRGEHPMTNELAHALEERLDVPAHVWLNLEAEYQRTLSRLHEEREFGKQLRH